MEVVFDNNLPIYIQVMDMIKKDIFNNIYHPGDKIASVREFALMYSVNPNTIQKALTELERTGIIYSKRATGRYVCDDLELINNMKKEVYKTKLKDFMSEMKDLGLDYNDVIELIKELV